MEYSFDRQAGQRLAFVRGTGIGTPDALGVPSGETSDVIVQWTGQSTGIYSYSGLFQLQDAYPTGVIGEVYANSTQLYAGTLTDAGADLATATPGQSESFSGSIALGADDKLYFAVNDNGDYGFDYTGFDVTISNGVPELPIWAMLIGGFAGLRIRVELFDPRGEHRRVRTPATINATILVSGEQPSSSIRDGTHRRGCRDVSSRPW